MIILLNRIDHLSFVMLKRCFLCGTNLKRNYYLDKLRLQKVNFIPVHENSTVLRYESCYWIIRRRYVNYWEYAVSI
jgi:hypothetical protein